MPVQLMTMPAAFDSSSAFPRAQSFSDIPNLLNGNHTRPRAPDGEEEFPRSASYTSVPAFGTSQCNTEKPIYRVASAETIQSAEGNNGGKAEGEEQSPAKDETPKTERIGRRKSLVARPKSWIQRVSSAKGSPERRERSEPSHTAPSDIPPVPSISKSTRDKTKTVSESFATFARKSWIASSRSPSPGRKIGKDSEQESDNGDGPKPTAGSPPKSRRSSIIQHKIERPSPAKLAPSPPKLSRPSSTFQKIKQRPQSVLMNFTTLASTNSSTSSLPRSSSDNRSTPRTSTDKVPPLPTSEKLQTLHAESPPRRDELWSPFRSLENDFSKFQSKTWSLKTNVVRSSLLPFLKNHSLHPSNRNLRPEDLDRRIMILNKWWRGLLDVLDGRQNQAVSGVDRPVLLEAALAIMMRPEWRTHPSPFAPVAERTAIKLPERPVLKRQRSSTSVSSSESQFVTESVYHNIRNLFIENLLTQMRFVVDKMSLRHAPASLVAFCGKAAAYAFFFVPGIAEVLVRIWKLQPEVIRRVVDQLGLPKRATQTDINEILSAFPEHTHSLGWSSARTMSNHLRRKWDVPIAARMIPWHGPWVARWCGRDSDMFFVFVKHYHILAEEFMSPELSMAAKARSPGFVLVNAQVLAVLEATIHRHPAPEPPPITFDDVLTGADANAAALPLPSSNSSRLMGENRLIMLLRDFLSERSSAFESARMTFAEVFANMMEAAAMRTSLFNHSSCFLLCDFMEEALIIYIRFQHTNALEFDFIDWPFWLLVCQKMLESRNTMSELRVFAFLYGTWAAITANEQRKEVLCLEWLLSEETFEMYFQHWNPMVRAYYMRLLCWRVCRDDSEATDLDTKIFNVALSRLKHIWAQYLFMKEAAARANLLPPSTAPCLPAPGRRLLIIRNDNHVPAASLFVGFDGIMSSSSSKVSADPAVANYRRNSITSATKTETSDAPTLKSTNESLTTPNKKRWTFMGRILPSTLSPSNEAHSSPTLGSSPTKTLEEARRETAIARSRPGLNSKSSSSDSDAAPTSTTHRAYSFRFSLEWSQNFAKREEINFPTQNNGRRGSIQNVSGERRVVPPRLPAPAQAWLGAKVPGISREVVPRDPAETVKSRESVARSKYAGRALAEWTIVVAEANNFTERRRQEGVPSLKWVEVPTLGVEGFRKFG
ncbi:hypothetical protein B0O99DRAFT_631788 [Bisporella sp. PMI_857]|nr:hypothetical protein B0O99DRAFT_631788 [Bisporella sp. PMI_857]